MFYRLILILMKWYDFRKYEIELSLYILFLCLMFIFLLDLLNN